MRFLLLLFFLVSGIVPVFGQRQAMIGKSSRAGMPEYNSIRFEHLSVEDGLSALTVNSIWQDRQGFMWFGTHEGLNRYDGYTFTHYYHDPADSTSLSWNYVEEILGDSQGRLWIGTNGGGLDRYDPATDSFIHYRHDSEDPASLSSNYIASLYEDSQGIVWIGTWGGGLNRFDAETQKFARFEYDPANPSSLPNNVVVAIHEDREGTLWVGTGFSQKPTDSGGLCRFTQRTETFTCFKHDPADSRSLSSNQVLAIHEDSRGTLWIGTFGGHGLHSVDDRQHGFFTGYPHDPDQLDRLSAPGGGKMFPIVTFIHEDASGKLWIGGTGLLHYDPVNETVQRFHTDPDDPNSLSQDGFIWEMYEDDTGVLWIGCGSSNCLEKVVPSTVTFRHYQKGLSSLHLTGSLVSTLHADRAGNLWVGTFPGGLSKLDRRTGKFTHYRHDPDQLTSLSDEWIQCLHEDHSGTLWVGTLGGGLNRFDPEKEIFTHFLHEPTDPSSLRGNQIDAIHEDQSDRLWISTIKELNLLDRKTGRFSRYTHDPANPSGLKDKAIHYIYETQEEPGVLWLAHDNGLSRFDPKSERATHFMEGTGVGVLFEDRRGRFWIGTHFKGLYLFDRVTGRMKRFTARDGLPSNSIKGILEDDAGHLWLSTGKGLSRFEPEHGTFRNFDHSDGLQIGSFIVLAATKGPNGALFFGGQPGFVSFYPDQFKSNPHPPKVVLTGFGLFHEPVLPSTDGPLTTPIWAAKEVTLSHDQHTFSFDFAGLHFQNPLKNQHQFILEGYDENWRDTGQDRRATYTKVPPGRYIFRVKAANSDGIWNEEGASIRVVVHPPWWRSLWAYLFYGILFVFALVTLYRVQRRHLVEKERERARKRELEQAREIERAYYQLEETYAHLKSTQQQLIQQEKLASLGQLTAGIAHEIKNPLNFVNNFATSSRELAEEIKEAAENGNLEEIRAIASDLKLTTTKIEEHGKRADEIVRSMLLHARGAHGERQPVDLNTLVDQSISLAYHSKRAQTPNFDCNIEKNLDQSVGSVEMIPQEIGRVLLNLLGNAFYAVHEKVTRIDGQYAPKLKVSTKRMGSQVEIRVEDNGPGIPEEITSRVFEPFFTTKPAGQGTGLGLSLAYEIITQGHGGKLEVESKAGRGATFIIALPYENAAFSEVEWSNS